MATAQLLYQHWSKILPKTNTGNSWEKSLQAATTYLKDEESKARYDRGLFNRHMMLFVKRIDMVLAGLSFGADEKAHLQRVGVEDFGFGKALVDQCIASRMAEKGLSVENRAIVQVKIEGQVRCQRCSALNAPASTRCRECGGSLQRKCDNPSCQGGPIPTNAKVCPSCLLPVMRGTQYRTLLRMADAFLSTGNHTSADTSCRLAEQILPGPAVNERLARSVVIRASRLWRRITRRARRGTLCGSI